MTMKAMIIGRNLNIADGDFQFMQLLLQVGVFLGHFLIFGLPLAVGNLKSLHLSLVVTSLDIGLSEPILLINAISHINSFSGCRSVSILFIRLT